MDIDVKPKDDRNRINLRSKGTVQVAVLTTADFDADAIDPNTVLFAGAAPVKSKLQDVDKDGDKDLSLRFRIPELDLTEESTMATLVGILYDGRPIRGTDFVNVKGGRIVSAVLPPLLEKTNLWQ